MDFLYRCKTTDLSVGVEDVKASSWTSFTDVKLLTYLQSWKIFLNKKHITRCYPNFCHRKRKVRMRPETHPLWLKLYTTPAPSRLIIWILDLNLMRNSVKVASTNHPMATGTIEEGRVSKEKITSSLIETCSLVYQINIIDYIF